jgi:hypothetical protein
METSKATRQGARTSHLSSFMMADLELCYMSAVEARNRITAALNSAVSYAILIPMDYREPKEIVNYNELSDYKAKGEIAYARRTKG